MSTDAILPLQQAVMTRLVLPDLHQMVGSIQLGRLLRSLDYFRQQYFTTTFSNEELLDEQQPLLSETWVGQGYEESMPLSDGYIEILERLEVMDTEQPEPRMVEFSGDIYFEYNKTYYEA